MSEWALYKMLQLHTVTKKMSFLFENLRLAPESCPLVNEVVMLHQESPAEII